MKKTISFLLLAVLCCVFSYSQECKKSSFGKAEQVDSTEWFMLPVISCGASDMDKYSYYGEKDYVNIYFYNAKDNISHKLLNVNNAVIKNNYSSPFFKDYYVYQTFYRNQIKESKIYSYLFYSIAINDYNQDGIIDKDDAFYIYVSDKKGENLKQISPDGCNVISCTSYPDEDVILVETQMDFNNDKVFSSKDPYVYYRISLKDFKCEKIIELK